MISLFSSRETVKSFDQARKRIVSLVNCSAHGRAAEIPFDCAQDRLRPPSHDATSLAAQNVEWEDEDMALASGLE